MKTSQEFDSVWDALEDDPIKAENMKLRTKLMTAIAERMSQKKLNQTEFAEFLEITQPRVSALTQGKIEEFRLDTLINIAHRLGLQVSLNIAA